MHLPLSGTIQLVINPLQQLRASRAIRYIQVSHQGFQGCGILIGGWIGLAMIGFGGRIASPIHDAGFLFRQDKRTRTAGVTVLVVVVVGAALSQTGNQVGLKFRYCCQNTVCEKNEV